MDLLLCGFQSPKGPPMTVAEYVAVLRRNLAMILLLMLVGGVGSLLFSQTLPKQFRSYASVIVIPERGESTSEIVQGSNYVQNMVQSYALLASTPYVLQPVIDSLQIEQSTNRLAQMLSVETPLNTVVIQISLTDDSPEEAQRIAAGITTSLIAAVKNVSPKIGANPAVHLETISPASLPMTYVSPDSRIFTAGGAAGGLVLALAIAFLTEQLRSRPRNADDIASFTDLPVLGEVPRLGRGDTNLPTTVVLTPDGQTAEALRAVAASLRFVSVDKPAKVIIVTSARPSDGKTSVATSLGLTLAEAGRRTLVIDADLRNPSVAGILGIEGSIGLTSVLVHDCEFDKAIQPWGHKNLRILAGGALSPNPGQLISSGQLSETIALARSAFDIVIIDTSPILSVSDASWLSPLSDGVIIVARARKTPIRSVRKAIDVVSSTHSTVLGIVVNAARIPPDRKYHGVYYGKKAKPKSRMFANLPKLW